ncbi:MAG: hypothetical protein GY757_39465, partial [bacterium]|nr:hypothetical protein [bacterium]
MKISKILLTVLVIAACFFGRECLFGTVYEVGPGKTYARIIDCPTHNLAAGDIINVYYRSTPYREKFLLHGIGTAQNPVKLIGIPDSNGNKPVIDAENAVSSTAINYVNEDRQIIKIGQYNSLHSDHVIVDGFVLKNAHRHNTYTDDHGIVQNYGSNACGIRSEYGGDITIRNCEMYNNENGVYNGSGNPQHLVLEYCY